MNEEREDIRQERRERKLQKKKEKVPQHSRGLARIYKEAIMKRINYLRKAKQRGPER